MTTAVPAATCSLRPAIMAAEGGSLVVEQRLQSPRTFQVHWAGIRTSTGGSDCGGSVELLCRMPICNCCRTSLAALA